VTYDILQDLKLRNDIINQEEMEVFVEMVAQMNTAERTRALEVLEKSVLGRELFMKEKIQDKQEVMLRFLIRRFNVESPDIQREVQQLNDLEVLDNILTDLFASTSLEEARGIIAAGVRKLPARNEP